jgi:hypothetical protein
MHSIAQANGSASRILPLQPSAAARQESGATACRRQTNCNASLCGWSAALHFFWQEPIQRVIDHPLTRFEIQGQIHVTECCDSMLDITFLMLDA